MAFKKSILAWYEKNARDLPWRKTRDPYMIWISEIILQQTRIGQGLGYYEKFISRFPGIEDLAGSTEEEVLKVWQGLGYYSRARNLHAASREIMKNHQGKFPNHYKDVIRLKGIGEYTAAAILSMSFGQPYPVVDGNVLRFISRYFGVYDRIDSTKGKKRILEIMHCHIGDKDPGIFNQSVMEFGALQCIPGKPDCENCPLRKSCHAFKSGSVGILPIKTRGKKQRNRYFNYLVIEWENPKNQNHLFVRKREGTDVWKNLYDFPLIETLKESSLQELQFSDEWKMILGNRDNYALTKESRIFKHLLTHQIIFARFFKVRLHDPKQPSLPYLLIRNEEMKKYPVPRLIEEYLFENPLVL
jgi:A/G-specific adenine glycosylase